MDIETIFAVASFVSLVVSWFILPGTAKEARTTAPATQLQTETSAA
ncbi:MAG: hypothetical protein HY329_21835 [Chloroflexi bacterium]|nr:hypothetical protein [Chloroflexota bacterium]